jgi:hypothetical protein
MERDGVTRLYCHRLDIKPPRAFQMYPEHRYLPEGDEATRLGWLVRHNVDLYFGNTTLTMPLNPMGQTWRHGDPDPLAHLPSRITWTFFQAGPRVPRGVFLPQETTFHVPNDGTNEYEYLIRMVEQRTNQRGYTIITC